jgi:sugar fermentation stimulation protein A
VLVGLNTAWPNPLAAEALAAGKIKELQGYNSVRREVKYGLNSRIDLLLQDDAKPTCYVEVKNVHLKRAAAHGLAEFPDCRTERGAKHLRELTAMVAAGHRAVMLYVVQRGDCDGFTTADDLDPAYGMALREAMAHGVEAICYDCRVTTESIDWGRPLPVQL